MIAVLTGLARSCRRLTQYRVLLVRYTKAYWRSPPFNTTRLIMSVLAAFIIGTFYWSRGDNYDTVEGVTAVLGAIFIASVFIGCAFMSELHCFWCLTLQSSCSSPCA